MTSIQAAGQFVAQWSSAVSPTGHVALTPAWFASQAQALNGSRQEPASCLNATSTTSIDCAVAKPDGDVIRLTLAMGPKVESFTLRRSTAAALAKELVDALK